MVDINQMLNFHLGGGKARKEVKLLKREVAHYRAISDITDRVSGSNEVYYETFDMTNNMSVGKIDLASYPINTWLMGSNDIIVEFYKDDLEIGQEVTVFSLDGDYKEVTIIRDIRPYSNPSFTVIEVDPIPNPNKEGNRVIICRSMAKIEEGKLHLDPPTMLEHDIRLNINMKGNKVRYIRDFLNGSDRNSSNHWLEIQAFDSTGENVALNKLVIPSHELEEKSKDSSYVTNGEYLTPNDWVGMSTQENGEDVYLTVDLGDVYDIQSVKIWHYRQQDGRTYNNTKTQVSEDGVVWYTIFDSAIEGVYLETEHGKLIPVPQIKEIKEKAYTIVSWVEQEMILNLEEYESTVEDTYIPPVFLEEGSEV